MNSTQKGILTLVRSGLTGEKLCLPDDFDLEAAYEQIRRHQMMPLAYEGAVRCGVDKHLPVMKKLFQSYCQGLIHSEKQSRAIREVTAAFDRRGVDYLPLKGCNLKPLYPKPELRLMGDADILIREAQYEQIAPLMQELGFTESSRGEYENTWDSPSLHLELHKSLVSRSNETLFAYFGSGWERALPAEGNRFVYTDEDQLIYLFMHFARHYRDSGIGLRHVLDFWVYNQKKPELDSAYLEAELKKTHLLEFYRNVMKMLQVWFADAPMDEKSAFLTDMIFRSGAFGDRETQAVSGAIRDLRHTRSAKGAAFLQFLRIVFRPCSYLCQLYPVLKKAPVLLPVFWPVYWIRVLLFRRDSLRTHIRDVQTVSDSKVNTYRQALTYVGLDYFFEG